MTGWGVERFGFRPFILGVLIYQSAITTIFFVAPSIEVLLVGSCFAGIAFGVFMSGTHNADKLCVSSSSSKLTCASVAISYASEICPVALRGYLTTWGNSCWGIGQLIAIAVIKSMFGRTDEWAYRIPYALQVSSSPEQPIHI